MLGVIENRHQQAFAWALFGAVLCFYTVAAFCFPMAYIWTTYEDLFGEWIQFWSLIAALVVSIRLSMARRPFRWFFIGLALTCFYVAMEEISWGQRLFGFDSPRFFRANNLQGETNFHNLLTGPYSTSLKAGLTYLVAAAIAAYGFVYPAALRLGIRPALWLDARGLAAPPLYLWPFFAAAAILECGLLRFNEAEIAELLVGIGIVLTAVQYEFSSRHGLDVRRTGCWPAGCSRRLALRMVTITGLVFVLSATTTTAVCLVPSSRARIDRRINRGIEKFAGRYARYEQWNIVAELYRRLHAEEPRRVSVLRNLADSYRRMGNQERFNRYIAEALALDLERYRKDPGRASVNRSLVRTYRIIGDRSRADKHLREALRISLKRINKHPTSADAAYSLGKTYSLMERHGAALEQLSRAYKLRPTSKKYRKAYYAARMKVRTDSHRHPSS